MKGTIEITVRTVPGGKVMTNVEGKKCSEKDVLEVMTEGFCAMAANCMRKVPQRLRGVWEDDGECAAGYDERRGACGAAV